MPALPPDEQQDGATDDVLESRMNHAPKKKKTTPLPWGQLLVIMSMRLAEPVAFSIIFPFIGDMIWDLHATDNRGDVGKYAGIVESLFAAVQTLTVLQWGKASDRLGRKPIILNGLLGSSISTILLGLSTSFPMLIAARCLSGALNGNVAIFKSTIGEMTDRSNSARAFSFLPFIWALGCTLGPLLGGYLSQPAKKYPTLFSTKQGGLLALNGLWEHFPYFLPCAVSGLLTWTSIILGVFFLKETLPSKVAKMEERIAAKKRLTLETTPLLGRQSQQSSISYDGTTTAAKGVTLERVKDVPTNPSNGQNGSSPTTSERPNFARPTPKRSRNSLVHVQSWTSGYTPTQSREASPAPRDQISDNRHSSSLRDHVEADSMERESKDEGIFGLLKIPHIRRMMISYAFLSLSSVSLDSVQVLYFWEPISLGGLSFPSEITGTFLSTAGIFGVVLQLLAFPYLQKRVGTLPLYRICLGAFPFVPAIMPFANWAARKGLKDNEHEGGFERDVEKEYKVVVYLLVGTAMAIKTVAVMAFSCNIILVNQASALAPGAQLGILNGLAQMSSSLMRAIGPYAASSLFALTLTKHLAGGYLIWIVLFIIGFGGVLVTSKLADIEEMIDRGEIDEDAANPRG